MINQEDLNEIRQTIIDDLKKSIKIYTQNGTSEWINEDNCRKLIKKLERKEPIHIGGPLWGDYVGAAIAEYGIPDYGPTRNQHYDIWKKIENGE